MIAAVKQFALSVAGTSGVAALARRLTAAQPRILMYHQFCGDSPALYGRTSARMLRQQLLHLRRHYRPVRLTELGRLLADGDVLPQRCVALTVDDGHANFLRFAVPLLCELGIPATFFVLSERSNSGEWLWTDKWYYVCEQTAGSADRSPSLDELRHMPAPDRERALDEFARRLGVRIPARPPDSFELATWDELKQLATSELIEIGSHSRTHRILSSADDGESWDEIDGSRRDLERRLGVEIATFCFPNGRPEDYRADQLAMLARAGYSCAVAAHFGYVTRESNRFALPRIGSVFGDMGKFRQDVDGLGYLARRIRRT